MFLCYEEFEDYVCRRIGALRYTKEVSARDMSLSMGQGPGYINNIENKNNLPSMRGFYYICEYLNVSPLEFFDENSKNPEKLSSVIADLKQLSEKQLENVAAIVKGLKR